MFLISRCKKICHTFISWSSLYILLVCFQACGMGKANGYLQLQRPEALKAVVATQRMEKQGSCAIAKITARCLIYT